MVVAKNQAILVAKTFDRRSARVYTVPLQPPASLMRPAIPEKAGILEGFDEPVTGADLSRDGRLVVCSTQRVGVYRQGPQGGWTHVATRRFRSRGDVEAVAWDGDSLILAGEGRDVFRIRTTGWANLSGEPVQKAEPRP
ncbi:MAG: hypothetical protein U0835_07115 [Isosphaeraceae bacterium]